MPVDPQIQALLDRGSGVPDTHTLPVSRARELYESRISAMAAPAEVASVSERSIDGPGGPLKLRIYSPKGQGPFPLMVFFHGSGFVLCSLETHDGMCRNLSAGAEAIVVSVDYRLAPEHPFPSGPEDCLVATRWAAENAIALGADPTRVMVAGDSAGGNMAAVTALRIRDEGGPRLCGQLLIYPVVDHYSGDWPSYTENAEGFGLSRLTMQWFWDHYLPDRAKAKNPHAAPIHAASLARLPPALIQTAEYDPLRDEAERYGQMLEDAGVSAQVTRYGGMNHGFVFWVGRVDGAGKAMAEACLWAKAAFASG